MNSRKKLFLKVFSFDHSIALFGFITELPQSFYFTSRRTKDIFFSDIIP